jgi:hypothetical protein
MSNVVLDLHGARARQGVDLDALETFVSHFRGALREYQRAREGAISRKGGRPAAREAAAAAFRLVEFHTGSGIATLAPSINAAGHFLELDDSGDVLAVTTLRRLISDIDSDAPLPDPVVESLSSARRAMGEDGSFGVTLNGNGPARHVLIDAVCIQRLERPDPDPTHTAITVTGRLHLIEADPPNRRVGVRAQDGIDWTCTYADHLHTLVTTLVERLVRITGTGLRMTVATGRLHIDELEPIPEHAQDALFSVETVPMAQLHAEQRIDAPQGLVALVDGEWEDDDESRLFLEATLGRDVRP